MNKPSHSLISTDAPWGEISFIHTDDTPHSFYSGINEMTGSRLSAFDSDAPGIDDPMSWVRSVFRGIHKKSLRVVSCNGNICPICKAAEPQD